ncbi:MAG: 4-hydroxy-tetrahydrodipicolinate synthase [Anaerovoracaceae bacterium]|nr:4-hydroxy-tetrahydrodipicolinate synthase [Bacillota bacterium]MDY5905688.1 4-hydroxy-tetrahydrodipicolinate synthase [Anaerovoracaceae bacterium]
MAVFTGAGVALVTPFRNGKVDFDNYGELIEWQIAEGTDAIISCGTTGEASTMTDAEQIEVVEYAVNKVNGRVPVIAGAGSNDTAHGVALSKELERAGADALLHVTPYYNKCTQKGYIQHMTAIADNVNIPIILYSVKSRTGVNVLPKTALELSKHPNIVGLKEASGDISQCAEMCRLVPDDFAIYSGNDDMVVPLLSLGGKGVISVLSNVAPKDTHDMVAKFFEGDIAGSRKIQLDAKPLIDALFAEVNPIPVKAALEIMGKSKMEFRLPLCEPEDATVELLRKELKAYGII